jgi:hypothetical protein
MLYGTVNKVIAYERKSLLSVNKVDRNQVKLWKEVEDIRSAKVNLKN